MLMRHGAAASPPDAYDRGRPLTNRGRGQSLRAGDAIRERGLMPERVILSSADRAQETWDAFLLGLDVGPDIEGTVETDSRIYDNTIDDLLDVIRETQDDVKVVLLIGHNPSVSGLASVLDEDPDNLVRAELAAGYPTATIAIFEFDGSWSELREGSARLTDVVMRRP